MELITHPYSTLGLVSPPSWSESDALDRTESKLLKIVRVSTDSNKLYSKEYCQQMFQAKSVMEKRKHHLHSSIRMNRNIRRSSSTSIIFGKQKHSNSTNFQTEYTEHKNLDRPPPTHHQIVQGVPIKPHDKKF